MLFDLVEQKPPGLEGALRGALDTADINSIGSPIERLLAIQDALEAHLVNLGQEVALPLTRPLRSQIASELRLSMFRSWTGTVDYLRDLARDLGMEPARLLRLQAAAVIAEKTVSLKTAPRFRRCALAALAGTGANR